MKVLLPTYEIKVHLPLNKENDIRSFVLSFPQNEVPVAVGNKIEMTITEIHHETVERLTGV